MISESLKFTFFNKKLEVLNIAVPLIFLLVGGVEIFFQFKFDTFEFNNINFIGQLFSFNSIHIICTPLYLLYVPEFRNYIEQKKINTNKKFIYLWFVPPLFFAILFIWLFHLYNSNLISAALFMLFFNAYRAIYVVLAVNHEAGQNFGISVINYSNFSSITGQKISSEIYFLEKSLWFHVILATTINVIVLCGFFTGFRLPIALFFLSTVTCHLLLIILKLSKLKFSFVMYKILYFMRYLLFPLSFMSAFCAVGLAAAHGTEHLLVAEKAFKNIKFERKLHVHLLMVLFLIIYFGALLYIFNYQLTVSTTGSIPKEAIFFVVSYVVVNSSILFHTFCEAHIFKFSDSFVKKNQGKLFQTGTGF